MRKPSLETALSCIGCAGLILLVDWHERSIPLQGVYFAYFANEPTVGRVLEGLLTTIALGAALYVVFQGANRWKPLHRDVLAVALWGLIFIAARDLFDRFYILDPADSWFASVRSCLLVAVVAVALVRRVLRRDAVNVLRTVGVFAAGLPLLVSAGLAVQIRSTARPAPERTSASMRGPRAVVLIFDELDYEHVYGSRRGTPLPAFDEIRREGLSAANAFTPGRMTSLAIASYLTGETIVAFELAKGKAPAVKALGGDFKDFATFPTLFSDVKQAGLRIAVGGAFQNYCRTFGAVIDDCFRVSDTSWPLREVWLPTGSQEIGGIRFLAKDRHHKAATRMYLDLMDWLSARVRDDSNDLVYAHVSVPHQPYLPWTDSPSPKEEERRGSYVRSVALADRTVAMVLEWLKQSKRADRTHLIVTSDHPLRSQLVGESLEQWKSRVRVPFVVHGPSIKKGGEYRQAFSTAALRELTRALLTDEVRSLSSINDHLDKRGRRDKGFLREAYPRLERSCLNYVIEGDKQTRYTLVSSIKPDCR